MTRYGMVVDTTRCVGCNACAMACKVENDVPNGTWWNKAVNVGGDEMFTPAGEYPDKLSMSFYTYACQHCDTPACVAVCPTEATYKREDGIVYQDYETCIGCKLCIDACPYTGIRSFNETAPEYSLDFAVGDPDVLPHQEKVVEKCTFCFQRIDRGENPACVHVCRSMARFFGDLDDPDSDVSQIIAARPYHRLLEDRGTEPNVYFLD